ncbi:Gelation factor [Cocos nucifera]|uniref:Gelation factor n=1 Tax=Cocos nucifera TaxID=13894 RepID=A0A8K0ND79_COCNU|nr:Gelation factor [Cocos nucifera]
MSAPNSDDKAAATGGRSLPPKLLTAALLAALLLWTVIDLSVVAGRAPPPSLHLRYYLGSYSASISFPSAAAAANATPSAPAPEPTAAATGHNLSWLSVAMLPNFTSTLLSRWRAPGGELCRDSRTANISVPALDGVRPIELPAGEIHEFAVSALDDAGRYRCVGGDYFETDLSGDSWKSRPPIVDHGNGSYTFKLQVHPQFAGDYSLRIVLLFRSFEGLKYSPERFKVRRELRSFQIKFLKSNASLPDLRICSRPDFSRQIWSGRWTRHGKNEKCRVDNDGRYRCLGPNFPCQPPWCNGPLAALESNGWVYSAHCSFRIFTQDSAWKCLQNKWLFFWGDSNHVDTLRNLLNFVLGLTEIPSVPRRFDAQFRNPRNSSQSVRITSVFNGHWNESLNYMGLQSLKDEKFRQLLWKYLSEDRAPDVMVLNSGLHDGVYWKSIQRFTTEGAEYAAGFWEEVMRHAREKGNGTAPKLFYRTTIATGGYARDLAFNPSKMEAFNSVMVEKLVERGLVTGGVIDEFDMTFPWHYDNRCNDGVHYGRPPAKARWRDGEVGHQYFVDLMLAHVLLNAICHG